jgi:hypothetical protein
MFPGAIEAIQLTFVLFGCNRHQLPVILVKIYTNM